MDRPRFCGNEDYHESGVEVPELGAVTLIRLASQNPKRRFSATRGTFPSSYADLKLGVKHRHSLEPAAVSAPAAPLAAGVAGYRSAWSLTTTATTAAGEDEEESSSSRGIVQPPRLRSKRHRTRQSSRQPPQKHRRHSPRNNNSEAKFHAESTIEQQQRGGASPSSRPLSVADVGSEGLKLLDTVRAALSPSSTSEFLFEVKAQVAAIHEKEEQLRRTRRGRVGSPEIRSGLKDTRLGAVERAERAFDEGAVLSFSEDSQGSSSHCSRRRRFGTSGHGLAGGGSSATSAGATVAGRINPHRAEAALRMRLRREGKLNERQIDFELACRMRPGEMAAEQRRRRKKTNAFMMRRRAQLLRGEDLQQKGSNRPLLRPPQSQQQQQQQRARRFPQCKPQQQTARQQQPSASRHVFWSQSATEQTQGRRPSDYAFPRPPDPRFQHPPHLNRRASPKKAPGLSKGLTPAPVNQHRKPIQQRNPPLYFPSQPLQPPSNNAPLPLLTGATSTEPPKSLSRPQPAQQQSQPQQRSRPNHVTNFRPEDTPQYSRDEKLLAQRRQKAITRVFAALQKRRDRGEILSREFEIEKQRIFSDIFDVAPDGRVVVKRATPEVVRHSKARLAQRGGRGRRRRRRRRRVQPSEESEARLPPACLIGDSQQPQQVHSTELPTPFLNKRTREADDEPLLSSDGLSSSSSESSVSESEAESGELPQAEEPPLKKSKSFSDEQLPLWQQQQHAAFAAAARERLRRERLAERRLMLMRRFDQRAPPSERVFHQDTSYGSKPTREQLKSWEFWKEPLQRLPEWMRGCNLRDRIIIFPTDRAKLL